MDLKETLTRISARWNYKMSEVSPGVFGLDVPLKLQDGTTRFQYVYARITKNAQGEERIYITSRCGVYNPSLNFYNILRETGICNYSTLTIGNGKDKDDKPIEVVMAQAAPLVIHTTPDLLDAIIFEVGNIADFVEARYFGGDTY